MTDKKKIIITVLLPLPFNHGFSYFADTDLKIKNGDVVQVPFGKRKLYGVVIHNDQESDCDVKKIKDVILKEPGLAIDCRLIEFIRWVSDYNLALLGSVLKLAIAILNSSIKLKKKPRAISDNFDSDSFKLKPLSNQQQKAADFLASEIESGQYSTTLIDGVTGCGKTEVYFSAIAKVLKEGRGQVLILLPEIILTSQLIERFEEQFGFTPQIWHSKVSSGKKRAIFEALNKGQIKVLIGTRSALFLPFKNLSLIIVDEEHDSSFKQEDVVNYNGRDMAIVRARIENFPVILSSATPSLESFVNAKSGKYNHLMLDQRFADNQHIEVNLIDMKAEKIPKNRHLSTSLIQELTTNLQNGRQSLLFLNRRGYAPLSLCKACGYKLTCVNCSAYITYHQKYNKLICHHCGYNALLSSGCPECKEFETIITCGAGVEKIAEEVLENLPSARIALMTSDNISDLKKAEEMIEQIINHEIDIIIGTQIIAKGHHFPALALVGIIDGDSSFYGGNLRAAERSYQLLTQVIGRAGRDKYQGKVILQSYNPDNLVFKSLVEASSNKFLELEIKNRKLMNMPPFSKMTAIIFNSLKEQMAVASARQVLKIFPIQDNIEIFGPAPMPITRIRNRYYYRLLIKCNNKLNIQKLIDTILQQVKISNQVRVRVDVDPV